VQPQQVPHDAFVVTVIKEPVREMTPADVIIGSLGIAGTLVVLALVLGAIAGGVLVLWNRRFPNTLGHLPPVSPSVAITDALPPPTQSQ
jgi:hypothetical protein